MSFPSPNLNSFLILGSWDNHEQEVESSSTNVLKGKSFPCYNCEYVATQNGHLKRHVIAKHSGERLECKSCGKKFTLKESLRRHVMLRRSMVIRCFFPVQSVILLEDGKTR